MVDLDGLYHRYPASPVMREAARNWLRALARSKAGRQSLTGSYFWLPLLDGSRDVTWEIKEFFDEWLPSSDHVYVWRHVRDFLEHRWKRSLDSVGYCCLPRGRVCNSQLVGPNGKARVVTVIYHGDDSPLGLAGLDQVRNKFNLNPQVRAVFDDHEQRLPDDVECLTIALRSRDLEGRLGGILRLFQAGL